jgi:hypothetical protein
MIYDKSAELKNLYVQHSQYSVKEPNSISYDSLLQWPSNGYFERFEPDATLLGKVISSEERAKIYSIADQIFGNQKHLEYLGLKHLANLFYERCQLHKQHIRDIDHRHIQIQEKKFGAEINRTPENAKRLSNLEGQLLQLEQQKRDEELAFWKDTAELREKLFETAALYRAAKQRHSIFSDVEGEGVYGR